MDGNEFVVTGQRRPDAFVFETFTMSERCKSVDVGTRYVKLFSCFSYSCL